jgi:hypothetical protein
MTGAAVVVAWTDSVTGAIKMRRSADGGATWNAAIFLGATLYRIYGSTYDGYVTATASAGHMYVAWVPDQIVAGDALGLVMRRSANGGATWHAQQVLAGDTMETAYLTPALAASGDRLVAVTRRSTGQLWVYRSSDGGQTIQTSEGLPAYSSYGPLAVSLRGSSARLIFLQAPSGIRYRSSGDAGAHWTSPQTVSTVHGSVGGLAAGAGPLGTVVAWHEVDIADLVGPVQTRHGS